MRGSACRRSIQRSLQKLERIGWVKRWTKVGQRGDYPMLIPKFVVSDLSGTKFLVNAEKTTDWRHPKLEPCTLPGTELSGKRQGAVGEASPLLQELENERIGDNPSPPEKAPSEEAIALTALLKQRILENNPTARITNVQEAKWSREADLMMDRDGRPAPQIRELIEWSQQDSFWRSNILSMGKLRQKFDQLAVKMNSKPKGGSDAEQRT